jgi:hypothetical protein
VQFVGGADEFFNRVTVLDVHPHETAVEALAQDLRLTDGAPAVLGGVIPDQDGPRLA